MARDPTWDAMASVAERLSGHGSIGVRAARRRSWLTLTVTQGLAVEDNWTDVVEPVRKRHFLSARWEALQTGSEVASAVGHFLRDRPDVR